MSAMAAKNTAAISSSTSLKVKARHCRAIFLSTGLVGLAELDGLVLLTIVPIGRVDPSGSGTMRALSILS
jgi:hypothetical protein